MPAELLAATNEYRKDMDELGDFIAERCYLSPDVNSESSKLFKDYSEWCEANGETAMSQGALGLALAERGFSAFGVWPPGGKAIEVSDYSNRMRVKPSETMKPYVTYFQHSRQEIIIRVAILEKGFQWFRSFT